MNYGLILTSDDSSRKQVIFFYVDSRSQNALFLLFILHLFTKARISLDSLLN